LKHRQTVCIDDVQLSALAFNLAAIDMHEIVAGFEPPESRAAIPVRERLGDSRIRWLGFLVQTVNRDSNPIERLAGGHFDNYVEIRKDLETRKCHGAGAGEFEWKH
jgi:hypothetical protein